MKKLNFVLTLFAVAAIGCAKEKGADIYSPPPKVVEGGATGGEAQIDFNPKLDVLFVIDNSESMSDEQAALRNAISKFVNAFGENSFIDYRIGVISVYDSTSCGTPNKHNSGKNWDCYPEGKLQPVRDAQGNPVANGLYVQRANGASEILKSTLNIGALKLSDNGPEWEEMFNPILKAVSPAMNNGANRGFLRPDSHKVIVIVSDEEDGSVNYTPEGFLESLYESIPARKLSLYGVLALNGCSRQSFAQAPNRIVSAIESHGGKTYRICDSNFGANLANMGSAIREKLYRIEPIQLPSRVQSDSVKVFYGDTEIPKGQGWKYDVRNKRIVFDTTINVEYGDGKRFYAKYTEVSDRAVQKGRAKPIEL